MENWINQVNPKYRCLLDETSDLHRLSYPTEECYRYFPTGIHIIEYDDNKPYKTLRRLFEGGITFNRFENEKIANFYSELDIYNEKYRIKKKFHKQLILPDYWKPHNVLRFLQARSYNIAETIQITKEHLEWRKDNIPIKMSNKSFEILNDLGFVYIHGRDKRYRPVICFHGNVFIKHQHNYNYNDWIGSIIFLYEYLNKHVLLPGQIENWSTIINLADVSIFSLPADFKKVFATLQCNYRGRLFTMYILNMSSFVVFMWNIIKGMLDPTTERKVRILKSTEHNKIFETISPNQVEKKFGGLCDDITGNFYPPKINNTNFNYESDHIQLVSKEEYIRIVENNDNLKRSPYINYEPEVEDVEEVEEVINYESDDNENQNQNQNDLNINNNVEFTPKILNNSNDNFNAGVERKASNNMDNTDKINSNNKQLNEEDENEIPNYENRNDIPVSQNCDENANRAYSNKRHSNNTGENQGNSKSNQGTHQPNQYPPFNNTNSYAPPNGPSIPNSPNKSPLLSSKLTPSAAYNPPLKEQGTIEDTHIQALECGSILLTENSFISTDKVAEKIEKQKHDKVTQNNNNPTGFWLNRDNTAKSLRTNESDLEIIDEEFSKGNKSHYHNKKGSFDKGLHSKLDNLPHSYKGFAKFPNKATYLEQIKYKQCIKPGISSFTNESPHVITVGNSEDEVNITSKSRRNNNSIHKIPSDRANINGNNFTFSNSKNAMENHEIDNLGRKKNGANTPINSSYIDNKNLELSIVDSNRRNVGCCMTGVSCQIF